MFETPQWPKAVGWSYGRVYSPDSYVVVALEKIPPVQENASLARLENFHRLRAEHHCTAVNANKGGMLLQQV